MFREMESGVKIMAKQDVNIGVEGNDGTGDSIRESFRKVNEKTSKNYMQYLAQGGPNRIYNLRRYSKSH